MTRVALLRIRRDLSVENVDHARCVSGCVYIVGDHHGGLPFSVQIAEKVKDLSAGGLVEIPGGLVGEEDGRLVDDRPGDGDAPLFAT